MDRQYRRVGTGEQHGEGTSLEWQLAKLAEVAPGAIVYCDCGYTGPIGTARGLLRLLNDTQPSDRVLVCKLDLLARNLRLLFEIEAKLQHIQVPLISIAESIDTSTAFGRMVFQLLDVVAEWERKNIIERTKNSRYVRYREGELDRQYRRVSTEEQKEGTSLDSQLETCQNKARELGYEAPEAFTLLENRN